MTCFSPHSNLLGLACRHGTPGPVDVAVSNDFDRPVVSSQDRLDGPIPGLFEVLREATHLAHLPVSLGPLPISSLSSTPGVHIDGVPIELDNPAHDDDTYVKGAGICLRVTTPIPGDPQPSGSA